MFLFAAIDSANNNPLTLFLHQRTVDFIRAVKGTRYNRSVHLHESFENFMHENFYVIHKLNEWNNAVWNRHEPYFVDLLSFIWNCN